MPDTIYSLGSISGSLVPAGHQGWHVPGWYPHAGSATSGSFREEYEARWDEFYAMGREELKAEVERLKSLHDAEGRLYTTKIRAQTYAAEDVFRRRFNRSMKSSAYPHEATYTGRPEKDPEPEIITEEEAAWIRVARRSAQKDLYAE